MTCYEVSPSGRSPSDRSFSDQSWDIRKSRAVELIGFALCVANAVYLVASFVQGSWLVDAAGRGIPTDFVNVWAAGRLVLDGQPTAAYDWTIHKVVEDAIIGYRFDGYYAWLYPPPFLFVAALLATMPFAVAQAVWSFSTFPAYVIAVRTIVGDRIGILLACAFPAILSNFMVGQNGFVSAALLAGALFFIERRPVLAGCFLGLLTYKPQFGLLFPLVLVAGGHWRVFWTAAIVAALLNATSWAAFGTSTWIAFIHSLPMASQAILTEGQADWHKLQSLFGIVRSLGGGEALAWSLQSALIGVVAILLCAMWRSRVSFELKAAALATGALLSTPYLYLYDYVMLAVPMAFLLRAGLATGFLRGEMIGLGAASLLILIFPFVVVPIGPLAILIVAALIGRRTWIEPRPNAAQRLAPA
jgi:arabinofuranan 3-O-arabinosyltransferase